MIAKKTEKDWIEIIKETKRTGEVKEKQLEISLVIKMKQE